MKIKKDIENQFLILKELLLKLISKPDSLESDYVILPDLINIYFFVDEQDYEPLIGKNGRIIHALRTIASVISLKFAAVPSAVYIESKNTIEPNFIAIKKQICLIGSDVENDEEPLHKISIEAVDIQDTPVTY
jgi:predicted RNA-binding protein YlqC (UPF0109 family)